MQYSVDLPALPQLPTLPPIPAPDAPAEHHASWLLRLLHIAGKVEHCGVRILESGVVMALLPPEFKELAAIAIIADTEIRGETAPAAPAPAVPPAAPAPAAPASTASPESSTSAGA